MNEHQKFDITSQMIDRGVSALSEFDLWLEAEGNVIGPSLREELVARVLQAAFSPVSVPQGSKNRL